MTLGAGEGTNADAGERKNAGAGDGTNAGAGERKNTGDKHAPGFVVVLPSLKTLDLTGCFGLRGVFETREDVEVILEVARPRGQTFWKAAKAGKYFPGGGVDVI